jgi:hypothetical protein
MILQGVYPPGNLRFDTTLPNQYQSIEPTAKTVGCFFNDQSHKMNGFENLEK